MRSRTLQTPAVRLHVVEDGDRSKPGILFLHGFPDNHSVWQLQMRALARDFHVISFDMRGCGKSVAPAERNGYRVANVLPDILAVIDATRGADGKVHLVGHDWGSVLGWAFMAEPQYAQRVLSWTSMSGPHPRLMWQWLFRKATSFNRDDAKAAFEQLSHSWYIFALNVPGVGRALFKFAGVEVWRQAMKRGGVPEGDRYLNVTQDEVERNVLNPIGLYQQNAFTPPPAPAPHSITTPTQLIIPVHDEFIRPQLFEYLDETCTDLTRVTLDANHWAQRSHPEEITALIRGFIARLEKSAAPKKKTSKGKKA